MAPTPATAARLPLTFGDEVDDCLRADLDLFPESDLWVEPERLVESERRSTARAPVHRPILVDLGDSPVECVLVDVSATSSPCGCRRGRQSRRSGSAWPPRWS